MANLEFLWNVPPPTSSEPPAGLLRCPLRPAPLRARARECPIAGPAPPAREAAAPRGENRHPEAQLNPRTTALRAGIAVAAITAVAVPAALALGDAPGAEPRAAAAQAQEASKQASKLRTQLRRERAQHERELTSTVRRERARRQAAIKRVLQTNRETGSVDHAIRVGAAVYGVSPDRLRSVARCESGLNPSASNGRYVGLFQFGTTLWSTTPVSGLSRTDPYAASLAAAWAFSRGMASHWPVCGR